MGRAICLCLLASLAVGLAVPVTDPPSPGNEEELMNIILNAKSEDNDIDGPPAGNELTTESKDNVTLDSAAVVEEGTQQSSDIVPDTNVRDISTTTEKIEDPATATKVNPTDLPKEPTELEPEIENVPLDSEDDQQYPPEKLSPEEQITGEGEIFEGNADVMSLSEGLLNGNDQIIIIPDEGQEIFDDVLEVPEEENAQVYGDQIVPEINEQRTPEEEEEEEEPEVILVLDEKVQFMPTTLEDEQFEGEEDDEQRIQAPTDQAQSGEEEIFIIEDGATFPTTEEKEESFIPFEVSVAEEEEVPVEDSFMERDRMPAQDPFMAEEQIPGENPFITDEQMPPMVMPEVSMMNEEVIIMPISEESYATDDNEDSVFGFDSSSYPTGNSDFISAEFDEDTSFPERPSFENFYIPDDTIGNEEISTFPENENDSFIDVGEVVLNEPIPSQNDNETPALVNILMIKAKPSINDRNPIIEVVSTGVSQMPPQFPYGVPLPINNDQEQVNSEIPERVQDVDVDILISDSEELPERSSLFPPNTLAQQPITFPEEFASKHNLPVFSNRWTEENFYQPQGIQSHNAVPFEPFTYSSYSRYISPGIPGNSFGSPSLPFNSYGPTQDQSFSSPEPFQQSFEGDQSGDMSGVMNDDMQSQMASTLPLSSTSDVTSFDSEDMQEDGQPGHFHMTDGVFQNSRFPNVPNRFDSFINSASDDDGTSQDFRGPNTFPLNFRNPNMDRDNMNTNIFDTSFRQDASLRPFQQNQQYDASDSFSPIYDSGYSGLPANQPVRFDVRFPTASLSKPFNPYESYGFDYPSNDNYYPFRASGLYSPQLMNRYMNRYSTNYPFGNFRPFNYPIPRW
ncbi:titin-like [Macrobrachium nipponense]|uniref:titin-like n=1 Tax=Macrobrachium nipponense TaxID=159736 RepID=UPI0030C8201C